MTHKIFSGRRKGGLNKKEEGKGRHMGIEDIKIGQEVWFIDNDEARSGRVVFISIGDGGPYTKVSYGIGRLHASIRYRAEDLYQSKEDAEAALDAQSWDALLQQINLANSGPGPISRILKKRDKRLILEDI